MPRIITLIFFFLSLWESEARVIVCDASLNSEITSSPEKFLYGTIFPSVAYFKFRELKIIYNVNLVMNGLLSLYSSKFLDVGYNDDGNDDGNEDDISFYNPESDDGGSYHPFPKLMLGNLGTTSFEDIKKVAKNTRQDFVILVLSEDEYSWKERFSWWWFQKVPRIPNQEYLATENSDPPYFLAVSQLDGQCKSFLYSRRYKIHVVVKLAHICNFT